MYNIRVKNFLSLRSNTIDCIFSFCHENFPDYIFLGLRGKDLIIKGFYASSQVKECRDELETFCKAFCFLCADCGFEFDIVIEEVFS